MNLFEEIEKEKEDFPKVRTITKEMESVHLNFYQVFAIVIFVICVFLGIFLGNLFSTCQASSYYYTNVCVVKEFNFSLMIVIWFISLIFCVFMFSIGHIVYYLSEINKKLGKNRD